MRRHNQEFFLERIEELQAENAKLIGKIQKYKELINGSSNDGYKGVKEEFKEAS